MSVRGCGSWSRSGCAFGFVSRGVAIGGGKTKKAAGSEPGGLVVRMFDVSYVVLGTRGRVGRLMVRVVATIEPATQNPDTSTRLRLRPLAGAQAYGWAAAGRWAGQKANTPATASRPRAATGC